MHRFRILPCIRISIHALRVEGDERSTQSHAVRTISIHALRVEGDRFLSHFSGGHPRDFYPRPPGGGRHKMHPEKAKNAGFLSTPSGWRATRFCSSAPRPCPTFLSTPSGWRATAHPAAILPHKTFLSTPSGWRATQLLLIFRYQIIHFYPRPPGGGRQQKRTKFSSVFAQKGEEFASLRRGKRKICRWRFKKDKFWVLIWCEGSGKSVCALASHCG